VLDAAAACLRESPCQVLWALGFAGLGISRLESGVAAATSTQFESAMSSSLRLARRRSTMTAVSAVVYPDSDKISIWTANGVNDLVVKRTGAVDYWDGETSRAKLRFGPLQAGATAPSCAATGSMLSSIRKRRSSLGRSRVMRSTTDALARSGCD
jgi:hypothetical protein